MASRLFSNYKSGKDLGPSIYEEMKAAEGQVEHVEHVVLVDEHRAIDEENLAAQYHDYDYDNAFPDDHESATESHAFLSPKPAAQKQSSPLSKRRQKSVGREKWMSRSPRMLGDDIDDGDVPASLLIEEEDEVAGPSRPIEQHTHPRRQRTAPPAKRHQAQGRQAPNPSWAKIHEDDDIRPTLPVAGSAMSPREIALWQWSQVENLSRYLGEVYDYFQKGGIYCICLARLFQKLFVLISSSL